MQQTADVRWRQLGRERRLARLLRRGLGHVGRGLGRALDGVGEDGPREESAVRLAPHAVGDAALPHVPRHRVARVAEWDDPEDVVGHGRLGVGRDVIEQLGQHGVVRGGFRGGFRGWVLPLADRCDRLGGHVAPAEGREFIATPSPSNFPTPNPEIR